MRSRLATSMPRIPDAQLHLAGDDVERVGVVRYDAHRGHGLMHGLTCRSPRLQDDLGRRRERVGAHAHGRGYRMPALPCTCTWRGAGPGDGATMPTGVAVFLQDLALPRCAAQGGTRGCSWIRSASGCTLGGRTPRAAFRPACSRPRPRRACRSPGDKAAADGAPAEIAGLLAAHGAHADGRSTPSRSAQLITSSPAMMLRDAVVAAAFDHRIRASRPARRARPCCTADGGR